MLILKKVAVTGGIATGKTTVCRFFEELGAYVISADKIVHQLLSPATDLGKRVIALLGSDIVEGGELNREVIAQKVFRDPSLLKQLEKQVHPEVQKVIESQYRRVSQQKHFLFVVEVPLLFESALEKFYDVTIVVVADEKRCRTRFMTTTQYGADEFDRRHQRLIPAEEKQARADIVIENNMNLESLRQAVEIIFNSLKENL